MSLLYRIGPGNRKMIKAIEAMGESGCDISIGFSSKILRRDPNFNDKIKDM